jgi:hypothetical protein
LPHEDICQLVISPRTGRGIDRETLRSAFRLELDRGRAIADQAVANALYNNVEQGAHALERDAADFHKAERPP